MPAVRRKIQLPFTSPSNARLSGTATLPTSSGIIGIGVIGVMVIGRSAPVTTKDARFVNCYLHKAAGRTYLHKRSGWAALNTPQSGSIAQDGLVWSGQGTGTKVITAFGATNSSIYDGTSRLTTDAADTTAITGLATGITETSVSGTATIAITSADHSAWYYQDGGTVTKIADAQFPSTIAGTFAHMDGYAFILRPNGDLWNSDLNSISSWTANNYIATGTYPDAGIAAVRWKAYIISFGTQSMEFFCNVGKPSGSPLAHVEELTQKLGAVAAKAIASIADAIFFVGGTPQGGLSVFKWDGKLERISTPEVDAFLLLSGGSNIYLTTLRDVGLSFVVVVGSGNTYVYCIEDNFWFEWGGTEQLWTKCFGVSVGTSFVQYAVSARSAAGKVFTINPQSRVFTDNGNAFTASAQMPTVQPGQGDFCAYDEVQVEADVESSASNLSLSWSDDDYATFSTARTLDLTTNGPKATRLGGTKNPRAFKLEHASNTPMRINAVRATVSIGR